MHVKRKLGAGERSLQFKNILRKLAETISPHVNHAFETYGFTPIVCKLLSISRMCFK